MSLIEMNPQSDKASCQPLSPSRLLPVAVSVRKIAPGTH